MEGVTFFVLFCVVIPVFIFFWNQNRTAGKVLAFILEEDKSVKISLYSIRGDFVLVGDEGYYIFPDRVRLTRYPGGWPTMLQQIVPVVLYNRGDAEPLDWNKLIKRTVSATEVGSAMEPEWLKNIVRGAREGSKGDKTQRVFLMVSIGISVICLLLLFYMLSRFGGLEQLIKLGT